MKHQFQSFNRNKVWQMQARQSGFTLIELMITLLLIAVVLSVGMPQMTTFAGARATRAQVSDLAVTMRLARTEAVKRGTRVTVCASQAPESAAPSCDGGNAWQTGWIMFTDRGAAQTPDGTDQIIRVQGTLTNSGGVTASGGPVSFFPNGIAIGGQRRFNFYPAGHSVSDPGEFALAMCQTPAGATRVVKYTEGC